MSSRPSLLGSPQETVDAAIKNHTVVVFSKEWCGFCRRAKDALDATIGRENYSLLEMESFGRENLVSPLDPQDFQDYFKTLCGTRSVPKVFFAGKFIGGGDETVALAQSGQLAAMAQAAGLGNAAKAGGGDSGSGGGNDGAKAAGVGGGATSKPPPAKSTNERFFVNGKMVDKPIMACEL
eukprot:CAMPEP_0178989680 /NCGR_PEP_ID=MMETSP0795-20121207/4516_1 /TAXON_ID=88552 /ORGANISM="Amoebophrya sp., Strain Ameob2" /LENGTH=179 /DNA_ID=CAMNT_0020681123 /DNA_START=327 /DNA_END=864 /DNA_ORIENTATION=+